MSFLTPLYLLGATAVGLPILLHLLRRAPRQRRFFSSLIFLAPSPPRWTRRSRLDQVFLLLLRALALILLALAFARPFARQSIDTPLDRLYGRRVALLVDTSASMRRGDLWQQAVRRAKQVLTGLDAHDRVALFTFADDVRTVVNWDDGSAAGQETRRELIGRELARLRPTWGHTELGAALRRVADALSDAAEDDPAGVASQIVLLSDLQEGAEVESLQAVEWPEQVCVSIVQLTAPKPGNAGLRLLDPRELADRARGPRVRVSNTADAVREQFRLTWAGPAGPIAGAGPVDVDVPAGQSRTVRIPLPAAAEGVDRLVLVGDDCDFDNTHFALPPVRDSRRVLYVGADPPTDPEGLLYYLQKALAESPGDHVTVAAAGEELSLDSLRSPPPHLVVVGDAASPAVVQTLDRYVSGGGSLLVVPPSREAAQALAALSEKAQVASQTPLRNEKFALLSDIDFSHPVFAALASPRYSDFTKIHFWRYIPFRVAEDPSIRVLARFDNGDPALWHESRGTGHLFVLASGWRPRDSQLALSSKFLPLLTAILESAAGSPPVAGVYRVHEVVDLPPTAVESPAMSVHTPSGKVLPVAARERRYRGNEQPGIYVLKEQDKELRWVVNLAASESNTLPSQPDSLEQFGVKLGSQPSASQRAARQRQLRDRELEQQQRFWQWALAAALGVLLVETWWGGRRMRNREGDVSVT